MRVFCGRGRNRHRWATREQLRQQASEIGTENGALTEWEVEQLLGLCGVPLTARVVDVDSVAEAIVETICRPKVSGNHSLASPHIGLSHLSPTRLASPQPPTSANSSYVLAAV